MISLPAGLLQTGAAGVVATGWVVPDGPSAALITEFYRRWRSEDQPPGPALAGAQAWLRDTTNGEKARGWLRAVADGAAWLPAAAADALLDLYLPRGPDALDDAGIDVWAGSPTTAADLAREVRMERGAWEELAGAALGEREWRRLAEAALAELPEMGLGEQAESEVRSGLAAALAEPPGRSRYEIRAVLTSRPELRAWLRERTAGETVRGGPARRKPMPADPEPTRGRERPLDPPPTARLRASGCSASAALGLLPLGLRLLGLRLRLLRLRLLRHPVHPPRRCRRGGPSPPRPPKETAGTPTNPPSVRTGRAPASA